MQKRKPHQPAKAEPCATAAGPPGEEKVQADPNRQAWTFSSSGWLFLYHFGVVRALKELEKTKEVYAIGSSGGACAGCYVHLDVDIDATVEYVLGCAQKARSSFRNAFAIPEYVRGALERFAPDNINEALRGNFEVSVTKLPWLGNVRIKEFASKKALVQTILASSCIMPGIPVYLDDHKVWGIDGGFSDFQILKGVWLGRAFFSFHLSDAISVCPFYFSRADITPSEYVPFWWAFYPPPTEKLRKVYHLGYRDALTWLAENNQIPYGIMSGENQGALRTQSFSRMWQAVQEASATAGSCSDEFEQIITEGRTKVARIGSALLCCLAWLLILLELGVMSLLSGSAILISPLLRDVSASDTWQRFFTVSSSAASPWIILKTLPAIGPKIDLEQHPRLQQDLRRHSFFYRVLKPLLC